VYFHLGKFTKFSIALTMFVLILKGFWKSKVCLLYEVFSGNLALNINYQRLCVHIALLCHIEVELSKVSFPDVRKTSTCEKF